MHACHSVVHLWVYIVGCVVGLKIVEIVKCNSLAFGASSTLKASLIIAFTVMALLLVGGIMVRRNRGLRQTQLEAKRYPHEHLHSAELAPKSKLNADDTLRVALLHLRTERVTAKQGYGSRLIKLVS